MRLSISRHIPGVFCDAMREGAAGAAHMFDAQHEHPELVWSDAQRAPRARHIALLADR